MQTAHLSTNSGARDDVGLRAALDVALGGRGHEAASVSDWAQAREASLAEEQRQLASLRPHPEDVALRRVSRVGPEVRTRS